jgi:hypothetical protein
MRSFIIVALLLGAGGHASAEVSLPPPPVARSVPSSAAAIRVEHEAAIANCVQMWDRGTHMTEQQWLRTCRRVQDRLKQLQPK